MSPAYPGGLNIITSVCIRRKQEGPSEREDDVKMEAGRGGKTLQS